MSNDLYATLGAVRTWIIESGLSERALAAKTGVGARTIGNFKRLQYDPHVSILAKVVNAMEQRLFRACSAGGKGCVTRPLRRRHPSMQRCWVSSPQRPLFPRQLPKGLVRPRVVSTFPLHSAGPSPRAGLSFRHTKR